MDALDIQYKYCPECMQMKDVRFFGNNKSKKDGLASYCKVCQRSHTIASSRKNKDYRNEQNKLYRKENKSKRDYSLKEQTEYIIKENYNKFHKKF